MKFRIITSAVAAAAMLFSGITYVPALNAPTSITAHATSKTADEAIAWVKSKVGTAIDYDGVYGAQCVDLILAYYNYLGAPTSSGNGGDYTWNDVPAGWSRLKGVQPQKGDILVYTDGGYGHVGIYESDRSHFHQNLGYADGNHMYVEQITGWAYNGFSATYWGVIRPNWSDLPTGVEMTEGAGQTIPDGDYLIRSHVGESFFVDPAEGNDVPAPARSNVMICDYGDTLPQGWDAFTFTYLGNGFYKIAQKDTDMVLDVYDASMKCGANVWLFPWDGNSAQQWSVEKTEWGYAFRSKRNSFVLDVTGGKAETGTNVEVWQWNGTNANLYDLIPYEEPPKVLFGDCNNDGDADILDLILFQKWLLGSPDYKLKNRAAADLNADGQLDVFDLSLMKRALLK